MRRILTRKCGALDIVNPDNYKRVPYHREDIGDSVFPISQEPCPHTVVVVREVKWWDANTDKHMLRAHFECGHYEDTLDPNPPRIIKRHPTLWERLLPFQQEGVKFAEENSLRLLIGDDPGLGKTISAYSILLHNKDLMLPCLIVTQANDIYRFQEEGVKWLGLDIPPTNGDKPDISLLPQVYSGKNHTLTPLSKVYICSWTRLGESNLWKEIERLGGVNSLIVDESQMYKDEKSARTKNLQKWIKYIDERARNRNLSKAPLIFLSGTPVMNRVMEFYPTLYALAPQRFGSPYTLTRMCIRDYNNKIHSIHPAWRDRFFELTKDIVIRRTKEQVKIPLPKLEMKQEWIQVQRWESNKGFVDEYNTVLDALEEEINASRVDYGNIMGLMSRLRRLVGLMKILDIAAWVDCFFLENPDEKLCVGIHHVDVREWLKKLLVHHKPLSMSNEDPETKDAIEKAFKAGESNLLIANVIACGQGRNFQFCRNALLGERQWNRAREEQYAQRFHRIKEGPDGRIQTFFTDKDNVTVTTLNARDTFDEYFDPMIHLKGIVVDSTDPSVESEDIPDTSTILELANLVVSRRIKFVGG